MHTQWVHNDTFQQFSPFNIQHEADSESDRYSCPANSLAIFALRDQSVTISSPLIDNLKSEIADARTLHFTKAIKESGVIINAFLEKGIGNTDKAIALINAIEVAECDNLELMWDDFISDAMDSLMVEISEYTHEALKDVKGIDGLLASVSKDYSLYDLSIEQNGGQPCDLVFQNTDFLCHIGTGLYSIENKALQYFYKKILDKSLLFGGIWQEDLVHVGYMEQWLTSNPKEIIAADRLLSWLRVTSVDKIDALLGKSRKSKINKNLFYFIDEMIEMEFCGDIEDKYEFKSWLESELEQAIKVNNLIITLNNVTQGEFTLSDCPSITVTEQITTLLQVCDKYLGSNIPKSFILDEDNMSHFTFVLKNNEKNEALDSVSQEQYERFCNAGEDNEIYRLNLKSGSWLDDLKEMTLALNITFVTINAILDWLRENETV